MSYMVRASLLRDASVRILGLLEAFLVGTRSDKVPQPAHGQEYLPSNDSLTGTRKGLQPSPQKTFPRTGK
ncbi:hypothetical protein SBA7_1300003 [Candidatus Sulfotelmatobacter sp. SbA7]|nr:hypothetical protein SBA7_1300003 [Candidatus Sulfotelmatobacter sp. SbA7]